MDAHQIIKSGIAAHRSTLIGVSDAIWDLAETRFQEQKSAAVFARTLEAEGFSVKVGVDDLDTALVASWGTGSPVIAFLGEYDALYGLSQVAGIAEKKPIVEGGSGHGCGHHALGTTALTGVLAAKSFLEASGLGGTLRFYGCPAEESGSGKVYMLRSGSFEGVDLALTCHPGTENAVITCNMLASISVYFKFRGQSSHAGASPQLGRSALDAVELMNVGANFLREHIVQEARLHYAITDAGGMSPNVVQGKASVLYQIRAPKLSQARSIYDRVVKIAKGAAMMTETEVDVVFDRASSDLLHVPSLERLGQEKLAETGPLEVDEEDLRFARAIRATLNAEELAAAESQLVSYYGARGAELARQIHEKDIIDIVYPYLPTDKILSGSTDVGDVSWNLPTLQINTANYAKGTALHSWQAVAQGKTELCRKAMLKAGEALALVAAEVLRKPAVLDQIKADFEAARGEQRYVCPIPPETRPSLSR